MEDLQGDQQPPGCWKAYKEAVLKPKRWIDGIGLMSACEVAGVRIIILQHCRKRLQWLPTTFLGPREGKQKATALRAQPV
eukprot:10756319-Alexandrium_andersonii.AAC.1